MNELINKSNKTPIEIALGIDENGRTTAKKLYAFLDKLKDFEELFIGVNILKGLLKGRNLNELEKAVRMFSDKYYYRSISYLEDIISFEMVLMRHGTPKKVNESQLREKLISDFNNVFPEYKLIGCEVPVNGIGRIDILAKDTVSGRDVIIELKVENKNPNVQLIAYGSAYENPILIGITEEKISTTSRQEGITYYTFKDLIRT